MALTVAVVGQATFVIKHMNMKKIFFLIAVLISEIAAAQTMRSPVAWSYSIKKINNVEAVITINAEIEEGWHIYSQYLKDGGPVKTVLNFEPLAGYELLGKATESGLQVRHEKAFKMDVGYFKNIATFQQKIKLTGSSPLTIKCKIDFGPCNDKVCLMPEETVLELQIS